jgi:hypothetical protein
VSASRKSKKKVVVGDLAAKSAEPKGGAASSGVGESSVMNNPLYKDSGMSGTNPLFANA